MLCIDFITYKYVNKQTSTVCQSAKLTSTRAVLIKAPGNISKKQKKSSQKHCTTRSLHELILCH